MVVIDKRLEDLNKNTGTSSAVWEKGEKQPMITLTKREAIDLLQQIEGIKRKLKTKLQMV